LDECRGVTAAAARPGPPTPANVDGRGGTPGGMLAARTRRTGRPRPSSNTAAPAPLQLAGELSVEKMQSRKCYEYAPRF